MFHTGTSAAIDMHVIKKKPGPQTEKCNLNVIHIIITQYTLPSKRNATLGVGAPKAPV